VDDEGKGRNEVRVSRSYNCHVIGVLKRETNEVNGQLDVDPLLTTLGRRIAKGTGEDLDLGGHVLRPRRQLALHDFVAFGIALGGRDT
jgi:hypothetical protein